MGSVVGVHGQRGLRIVELSTAWPYTSLMVKKSYMTTAKINRAIKDLGLEIIHERGSGYGYFLDLVTRDQIGESVQVCYLNQLSLEQWVEEAVGALEALA